LSPIKSRRRAEGTQVRKAKIVGESAQPNIKKKKREKKKKKIKNKINCEPSPFEMRNGKRAAQQWRESAGVTPPWMVWKKHTREPDKGSIGQNKKRGRNKNSGVGRLDAVVGSSPYTCKGD